MSEISARDKVNELGSRQKQKNKNKNIPNMSEINARGKVNELRSRQKILFRGTHYRIEV